MAISKSKQKTGALEQQLDEAKKDIVLKVNSRDQDRFRYRKTLEALDSEVEE